MRFISADPPLTIYTAYFTIKNSTVLSPDPITTPPSLPTVTQNPGVMQPFLTLVLPNVTITSRLLPTSTIAAATTIYASSLNDHGDGLNQIHYNGVGESATRSKRIDLEKLKFRLVFILWPALIGITMAL